MIGAICDISIALSMPYYVRNLANHSSIVMVALIFTQLMRRGTGSPSTHVLIVRLVRLLFETGGFTGTRNLLFGKSPKFEIHSLIFFPQSNHGHTTCLSIRFQKRIFSDTRTLHVENICDYNAHDFQ